MKKRRVLISSDQAVPAKVQHEKACSDCPWSRTALNGWLGSNSKEEWIEMAHGEANIECHVLTGVQCAGAAIYRANVYKCPRDRTLLRLPRDTEAVFETAKEFLDHHSKIPQLSKRPKTETRDMATETIQKNLEEIEELINEIEGDTKNITRAEYREFLEELAGILDTRLMAIDLDERNERRQRGEE